MGITWVRSHQSSIPVLRSCALRQGSLALGSAPLAWCLPTGNEMAALYLARWHRTVELSNHSGCLC